MFSILPKTDFNFSATFHLLSATAFNLDQAQNLFLGKELNGTEQEGSEKLVEKAKMLVISISSFSNNVFTLSKTETLLQIIFSVSPFSITLAVSYLCHYQTTKNKLQMTF